MRIGQLIDRHDRWWKNDPNGPEELTEAVSTYGLPWFDTVRTVEDQAARWYGRASASLWRVGARQPMAEFAHRAAGCLALRDG